MRAMTGTNAPVRFAGAAMSVTVIATRFGATVLTNGADTVAEMLPAGSATVDPNTPPVIETGAPGVKPAPVNAIGLPLTKQAPPTASGHAWAAAGGMARAPAPPAPAGETA